MPVMLRIEHADLVVEHDGAVLERERLVRARVSEAFAHAPRQVLLPSGVTLEVPDDGRDFARELEQAGVHPSLAVRLRERWLVVLVALGLLAVLLAAAYVKALPVAARWAAFALPDRLEARMGRQLLAVLDSHYLRTSRLEAGRRARIAARFTRAAAVAAPGVSWRLEFRAAREDSVNAMTLPGGIIVLLDDLVTFAGDEDAVLGVLGHELGHVVHKHSTREVFQTVGVGAVAGLLWGDFSGVAASAPVALSVLRYSRDFEREADEFAVSLLRAAGLSARPFHDFLQRLQRRDSHGGRDRLPDFLSTHPSTDERLQRLRRESA
jgi:predicted Zn-dependent protease